MNLKNVDWMRLWPSYWAQNYPTNLEWDEALNELLDKHEVNSFNGYTCIIGGVVVWCGNYPYAYGSPFVPFENVLPKVSTRIRLKKAVGESAPKRMTIREKILLHQGQGGIKGNAK